MITHDEWLKTYNLLSKQLYDDVPILTKDEIYVRYSAITEHYMKQPIDSGSMLLINDFGLRHRIEEYFGKDWSKGYKNGSRTYKINVGNIDNVDDFLSKIKKRLTKDIGT